MVRQTNKRFSTRRAADLEVARLNVKYPEVRFEVRWTTTPRTRPFTIVAIHGGS